MNTNELGLQELVDKLESTILNISYLKSEERLITPNFTHLADIKNILNDIFPENNCSEVFFTSNTDKPFFGVKINPVINGTDALTILVSDEKVKLNKYQIEFDSKLFNLDLEASEIVAFLLFEISSMVDSYETIDQVRNLIDMYLLSEDEVISFRDSANYAQLIIFALKDTLYKVSSSMFKEEPEELTSNRLILATELQETLLSAHEKIISSCFGLGETVRSPKTIILRWMFMVYKDIKHNSNIVKETLKDARTFTASRLEIAEIDKTIQCVDNINALLIESVTLFSVFESKGMSAINELSLFKSLKRNGLKSIEDDLYEYALRMKNLSTEEDAMYILRCINTRLNILEDYIYNTPELSDYEKSHWEAVAIKYRELREQLSQKKIWKKNSYGLFMDYNQLDYLDSRSGN